MIRYYFGSKQGLYEAMIGATLGPLLDVLDGQSLSTLDGFAGYLRLYYRTMLAIGLAAREPAAPATGRPVRKP